MAPQSSQLESALERKFRLFIRRDLGGRTTKIIPFETGAPDRLVVLPGGHMELVELKKDGGVLSPKQRLVHAKLKQIGTVVTVLTGEDEILAWVASRRKTIISNS